ncbi:MAG TPA: Clp protease N-terminal domain-containing protein [Spirillospora sp.]
MRSESRTTPADASREVTETLVRAFRRAAREERRAVGTEHVLHALLDGESAARDLVASTVRDTGALMGTINAKGDEHWTGRDDAGDGTPAGPAVMAVLREAAWTAGGGAQSPRPTGALTAALAHALRSAGEHGVSLANPSHLLVGLLHDPGNRACEALLERRIDRGALVAAVTDHPSVRRDGARTSRCVDGLRHMGMLTRRGAYWSRLARALSSGGFGSPIMLTVRREAKRQAVRLGHPEVTAPHLLLGMLVLDDELAHAGLALRDEWTRVNKGAELLRERGVTLADVANAPVLAPAEGDVQDPSGPRMHEEVEATLNRARLLRNERKDPSTGTTHLLAALVAEPDGPCDTLLTSLGVKTGELCEALGQADTN